MRLASGYARSGRTQRQDFVVRPVAAADTVSGGAQH
jgi:hypothetical protein